MASRQEEKERRRREREEAERKAQKGLGGNRKRLGYVLGGVLAAAVAVIVILAVSAGGDGGGGGGDGGASAPNNGITNLAEAARAADCEVKENLPDPGSTHVSETVKYATNPPTSGDHDPQAAQDGIYASGNPPDLEQSVHALEHGRINFQYREGTPQPRIDQLEGLVSEQVKGSEGYHSLLFQNATMSHAVAATAWRASITCAEITDQTFDALRAFRLQRIDKAPEFVP